MAMQVRLQVSYLFILIMKQLTGNGDRDIPFYIAQIDNKWTAIFAVDRYFIFLNGRVTQWQLLLDPASSSTMYGGQGCNLIKFA